MSERDVAEKSFHREPQNFADFRSQRSTFVLQRLEAGERRVRQRRGYLTPAAPSPAAKRAAAQHSHKKCGRIFDVSRLSRLQSSFFQTVFTRSRRTFGDYSSHTARQRALLGNAQCWPRRQHNQLPVHAHELRTPDRISES